MGGRQAHEDLLSSSGQYRGIEEEAGVRQPGRGGTGQSGSLTPAELIDQMIAKTPDWRGATFKRLRRIIHDADPEITEEVKWRRPSNPLGAPVWEHNGIVCIGAILKERVRLTMIAGTILPDPQKLYNAMLNGKSRAIDFYEGDMVNEPAVKALIQAGVKHNIGKVRLSKPRKK